MPRPQAENSGVGDARRVALGTLGGVVVGGTWGATLGFLRSQHVGFYATTMGANFGIATGCFLGVREGLVYAGRHPAAAGTQLERMSPTGRSTVAGAVTGGLLTTFYAGPVKGVGGAALWASAAYLGQRGVDAIEDWLDARSAAIVGERQRRRAMTPEQRAAEETAAAEEARRTKTRYAEPQFTGKIAATAAGATPTHRDRTQGFALTRTSRESSPGDAIAAAAGARATPGAPGAGADGHPDRKLAMGAMMQRALESLPSWFPISRMEDGEYEGRLRKRLAEVEELLRAGERHRAQARDAAQRDEV